MSWTMYRWLWQLRSPLHVGHTPAGALNRTRLYIPARNMWAALTAEIARQTAGHSFPSYEDIGRELQEHVRFTYLFPAERVNGHWHAWLPRYDEDKGLLWHREDGEEESDRRFRRRLLHTRPSTALAPGSGAAAEGTLREVECIATHWKPEQRQVHNVPSPVAFMGYVFLKDTLPNYLKSALENVREIFIGGEIRYGFGCLSLLPSQAPWEQARDYFGTSVDLTQDDPLIENPHHLLAHTLQDHDPAERGAWELLVQWDWNTLRSLQSLLWVPGSQSRRNARFIILNSGLWRAWR